MAIATGRADFADDREHDVLGCHPKWQLAFYAHQHVLHFFSDKALGGQYVFDLRRANTVGQGAERAMGRGVRVAADHGHARQCGALLRADHVNDALTHVVHFEFGDAVLVAVVVQGLHLQTGNLIGNRFNPAFALRRGRYVMVRGRDIGIDAPRLAPCQTQAFERLRRGHFMNDVTVDIDQRRSIVALLDQMRIPELVVERFAGHHTVPHQLLSVPITTWLVRSILWR